MNLTIEKFGYPDTLVLEYDHWVVLMRPTQVTLGSLVMAAKSDVTAYSGLSHDAMAEQWQVVGDVERSLRRFVEYDKINYLMLMMVDREVHFHVIPRYSGKRSWGGMEFVDSGWPKAPDLASAVELHREQLLALTSECRIIFANR